MGPHVLIVDDDPEYAALLAARVSRRQPGSQCQVCTAPRDALDRCCQADLVIVDLEMPDLDGMGFLREAVRRGLDPDRVVINSTHGAAELHRRFHLGECLAVLDKLDAAQQHVLDLIVDGVAARRARTAAAS